jgi:hypothetical protein
MQITTTDVQYQTEENFNKITSFERLGYMLAITLNIALGLMFTMLD